MTDLERIGGMEALAGLMRSFVARAAGDFVIGFRFAGKDLDRIAHFEAELAASHLGGGVPYSGRSIGQVHEPLRISRGQFHRRLAVLRTVLADHHVPQDIIERWIAHDAALEPVVADATDCSPRVA